MPEILYLLLIIAAVYAAGWLFERVGQSLGSNPTALGWNDQPHHTKSIRLTVRPWLSHPDKPDWQRFEEATRFPTEANWYGALPVDMPDEPKP